MHFDVRVLPITSYLDALKAELPKKEYKAFKDKVDVVVKQLIKRWPTKADEVKHRLLDPKGEMVGNIVIDRFAPLQELREFARDLGQRLIAETGMPAEPPPFAHLLNTADTDGMLIPIKFKTPMSLTIPGRQYPFQLGSILNLRDELDMLNQHLHVERTFKLHNLPPFVKATAEQMEKMEVDYHLDDRFWIKFAFVVLRSLNTKAIEHKCPMIFHYE